MPSLPLDDANRPLFTVGQVSEMLKVQQAFLRRLDEFDVVSPSRSAGGQRRYSRNEIVAVSYVVELVDDGLTLSAVRRVLQLEARLRESEARLREADARLREAGARLVEAEARLRELSAERDQLRSAIARLAPLAPPRPGEQRN